MSTTNIVYKGEVSLAFKVADKWVYQKVHNSGTNNLFRLICKAISGYNVYDEIPKYIDLRVKSSSESEYKSILNNYVPLTNLSYVFKDEKWVTKGSALISLSTISGGASTIESLVSEGYTFTLNLMSGKPKSNSPEQYLLNDLAYINIAPDDLLYVSQGSQMLIDWTLGFENK